MDETKTDQLNWNEIAHGFHIFRDGNMWCAVGPHFQNLQQSNAGFGATPELAVANLHKRLAKDRWWNDKILPPLDRFVIHEAA